jgi:hypothetical protein
MDQSELWVAAVADLSLQFCHSAVFIPPDPPEQ